MTSLADDLRALYSHALAEDYETHAFACRSWLVENAPSVLALLDAAQAVKKLSEDEFPEWYGDDDWPEFAALAAAVDALNKETT